MYDADGLPDCASLAEQTNGLCSEGRRVSGLDYSTLLNSTNAPAWMWQPHYPSPLFWLGGGDSFRCARDLDEAIAITSEEATLWDSELGLELSQVNTEIDLGRWFTLHEQIRDYYFRVVDCSWVSAFVGPHDLDVTQTNGVISSAFAFTHEVSAPELIALIWEIEANRRSDDLQLTEEVKHSGWISVSSPRVLAVGTHVESDTVTTRICAFGLNTEYTDMMPSQSDIEDPDWILEERTWTYDGARQALDYEEILLAELPSECVWPSDSSMFGEDP